MKTDDPPPDPWLLEDVQLRCALAAERLAVAIDLGTRVRKHLRGGLASSIEAQLGEVESWRQRVLSYVYHIGETNLTFLLRRELEAGHFAPPHVVEELRKVLKSDLNSGAADAAAALKLLDSNVREFVRRYFAETHSDDRSKGDFSVTSR